MQVYRFNHPDMPFQLRTGLRFLQKSCVARRQYNRGERVTFGDNTKLQMVIPSNTDTIKPYITATCPDSGCVLRLNFDIREERKLENQNDALAYLRRTLCVEALSVTMRDLDNVRRFGVKGHYTEEFHLGNIEKYQWRIDNFHTYAAEPVYD